MSGKVNCTNDGVQNLGNPSDVTNQSTDSATNQNKEPVLSSNQGEELDPSTNQRPDLTDKPANQNEGCPKSVIESDVRTQFWGKRVFCYCCKMGSNIFIVGFILSSVFTYVQNLDEPIYKGTRKPEPFFRENSTVRDYWRGDVFKGFKDASYFENSLFMFYATWDRESQEARHQMEEVGQFFSESDILVAAVNCWYPASDCAKEFGSKSGQGNDLPVFIFYPKLLSGIQFRGTVSASEIIRFVLHCRYPVTHLHSLNHFRNLQVEYESVLLGYLPSTNHHSLDNNHQEFHKTAYSILEAQAVKSTILAAVTSESLGKQLHLHVTKPVRLVTHNDSFVYPNKTLDADKLVSWSLRHSPPAVPWINLPNRKSVLLKSILERGSGNVLLLFGARSNLRGDTLHTILRQVSADYLNCDKLQTVDILVEQLKSYSKERLEKDDCRQQKSGSPWTTVSSCQLRSWSSEGRDEMFPACSNQICSASGNSSLCLERQKVLLHLKAEDPFVRLSMRESSAERAHEQLLNSREMFSNHKSQFVDISGLGCNSNRTLRLYRVDSETEPTLLTSLGLVGRPLPLPVILVTGQETVYLPNNLRPGHFEEDLRRFVVDWHTGSLNGKPGFRSTEDGSVVRFRSLADTDDSETSVIKELSAATFSQVLKTDKDVVLLYTSSFCSHCTVASHVFHTVKLYLEPLPNIRFMIVDGTKNDLDWQFTALSYPSILFIPSKRSDLSRVYPTDLGLTTANLVGFVVSNLRTQDRILLSLSHCQDKCRNRLRLQTGSELTRLSRELQRHGARLTNSKKLKLTRRRNYCRGVLNVIAQLEGNQRSLHNKIPSVDYDDMIQSLKLP